MISFSYHGFILVAFTIEGLFLFHLRSGLAPFLFKKKNKGACRSKRPCEGIVCPISEMIGRGGRSAVTPEGEDDRKILSVRGSVTGDVAAGRAPAAQDAGEVRSIHGSVSIGVCNAVACTRVCNAF